jgi:hypothetical protein
VQCVDEAALTVALCGGWVGGSVRGGQTVQRDGEFTQGGVCNCAGCWWPRGDLVRPTPPPALSGEAPQERK